MRHVFLSYCHDDADFAQILREQIHKAGLATWKDLDLRAGDNWPSEIDDALKGALAVVLVMSARAKASEYVSFEWAFALGAGIPVLPLLLKTTPDELHPRLRSVQTLDFSTYQLRPWEALTQRLKEIGASERLFTVRAPRGAPPVIQEAARALDSLDANERIAAIKTLAQMKNAAALDVLAEALQHPVGDVQVAAAIALAKVKDLRALSGLFEAIRAKRFDDLFAAEIDLADFGSSALPVLISVMGDADEDEAVRMWAASALGRMKNTGALPALRELLSDSNTEIRKVGVDALSRYDEARPWILECFEDKSPWVAGAAIKALTSSKGVDLVAALIVALQRRERDVRWEAAHALIEVGDATAIPALLESLQDEDDNVRSFSARALERFGDASAVPGLLQGLHDKVNSVRNSCGAALGRIGGAAVLAGLVKALSSTDSGDRRTAAWVLGSTGDHAAVPPLLQALDDEDELVRRNAARSLGQIRAENGVPNLIALLKNDDEEDDLRESAAEALKNIGTLEARAAAKAWERQTKKRDT